MSCVPCLRSCNNISRRLCYVTLDMISSSLSLIRQAVVVISSPLSLMSARYRTFESCYCRNSSPCRRSCINISSNVHYVTPRCCTSAPRRRRQRHRRRLAAEGRALSCARLIIFCCSIAALQHRRALCHTTLPHLSAKPPSSTSSPSSSR